MLQLGVFCVDKENAVDVNQCQLVNIYYETVEVLDKYQDISKHN